MDEQKLIDQLERKISGVSIQATLELLLKNISSPIIIKLFLFGKRILTPLYVHLILVVFLDEVSSGLAVVSATEIVTGARAVTSEFFTCFVLHFIFQLIFSSPLLSELVLALEASLSSSLL